MLKTKKFLKFLFYPAILLTFQITLTAQVPNEINYQGTLNESGIPVNGTKTMNFRIFDSASGGADIWSSGDRGIAVSSGVFNYKLGSNDPDSHGKYIKDLDWANGTYWLELSVESIALSPREKYSTVPYAFEANRISGMTYEAFVSTSGAQVVGGAKTFEVIPVLPSIDPTEDNHAVRKIYVDNLVGNSTGTLATKNALSSEAVTRAQNDNTLQGNINGLSSTVGGFNGRITNLEKSTGTIRTMNA